MIKIIVFAAAVSLPLFGCETKKSRPEDPRNAACKQSPYCQVVQFRRGPTPAYGPVFLEYYEGVPKRFSELSFIRKFSYAKVTDLKRFGKNGETVENISIRKPEYLYLLKHYRDDVKRLKAAVQKTFGHRSSGTYLVINPGNYEVHYRMSGKKYFNTINGNKYECGFGGDDKILKVNFEPGKIYDFKQDGDRPRCTLEYRPHAPGWSARVEEVDSPKADYGAFFKAFSQVREQLQ